MERRKRKGQGLLDFSFMKSINWVHSIRHPLGGGGWSRVGVLFLSFNLAAESVTWVSKSNGGTDSGTGPTPAAQAICEGILVEIG
jgi:hypothetical protein